jgi:DNA-binding helix-turn-helix protein
MNTALKKARKNSGLTQAEVAKKATISYRAYQDYEAEVRVPNVYAAQSIAKALKSTVHMLWPLKQWKKEERQ